jgi:hypothetical protein
MRKLFLLFSLATIIACNSQQKPAANDGKLSADLVTNPVSAEGASEADLAAMPTMDFTDTMHNFGSLKEGDVVTYDFEFKNNGKKPLLISGAVGSCGCTAPDYPHKPIEPGETANITVKFNTDGKQYHQEKSVTIATNSRRGTHMLYIKADVEPDKNKPSNELPSSLSNH